MKRFLDPEFLDPNVTIFSACPTCRGLISIELKNDELCIEGRNCPHCGIEIYEEEIVEAAIKNILITQAVSSANKISSFDIAVLIFITVSLLVFFFNQMLLTVLFAAVTLIVWTIPLVLCVRWFHRHGRWQSSDEDYLAARRETKKSGLLWLAAHIFNILLIIFTVYL